MQITRIAVVISSSITREGIRSHLSRIFGGAEFAVFESLAALRSLNEARLFDVVIWDDHHTPPEKVCRVVHSVRVNEQAAVIVVSRRTNITHITQVMKSGALGFVCREDPLGESLEDALRCALRGVVYFSPRAAEVMYTGRLLEQSLTPRDRQLLRLMAEGDTMQVIAQKLGLSVRTLYRDRSRLRETLGVRTNEQIVDEARQRGLI